MEATWRPCLHKRRATACLIRSASVLVTRLRRLTGLSPWSRLLNRLFAPLLAVAAGSSLHAWARRRGARRLFLGSRRWNCYERLANLIWLWRQFSGNISAPLLLAVAWANCCTVFRAGATPLCDQLSRGWPAVMQFSSRSSVGTIVIQFRHRVNEDGIFMKRLFTRTLLLLVSRAKTP